MDFSVCPSPKPRLFLLQLKVFRLIHTSDEFPEFIQENVSVNICVPFCFINAKWRTNIETKWHTNVEKKKKVWKLEKKKNLQRHGRSRRRVNKTQKRLSP